MSYFNDFIFLVFSLDGDEILRCATRTQAKLSMDGHLGLKIIPVVQKKKKSFQICMEKWGDLILQERGVEWSQCVQKHKNRPSSCWQVDNEVNWSSEVSLELAWSSKCEIRFILTFKCLDFFPSMETFESNLWLDGLNGSIRETIVRSTQPRQCVQPQSGPHQLENVTFFITAWITQQLDWRTLQLWGSAVFFEGFNVKQWRRRWSTPSCVAPKKKQLKS